MWREGKRIPKKRTVRAVVGQEEQEGQAQGLEKVGGAVTLWTACSDAPDGDARGAVLWAELYWCGEGPQPWEGWWESGEQRTREPGENHRSGKQAERLPR